MCCSIWPAAFSKTITGTWEVLVDGRINHVLWYQNRVGDGDSHNQSHNSTFETVVQAFRGGPQWHYAFAKHDELFSSLVQLEVDHRNNGLTPRSYEEALAAYQHTQGMEAHPGPRTGNSLIIPLQGNWDTIKLLDTSLCGNVLGDIADALVLPVTSGWGEPVAAAFAGAVAGRAPEVRFIEFDIYFIVLAEDGSAISRTLEQVPANKRPVLNDEVLESLSDWYRCPIALCCFDNRDSGKAKPIAFAFEPLHPDTLVVYTLDGHNGKRPVLNELVRTDHTVFVGSYKTPPPQCAAVNYSDSIPDDLNKYMLRYVMGVPLNEQLINGDITFPTESVRQGIFQGLRSVPPFAPRSDETVRLAQPIRREAAYIRSGAFW